MQINLLDPSNPEQDFPDIKNALTEPNGLLAVGGCLSPQRIITAYKKGIFPWYSPNEPILWWSPNPRLVLFPDKLRISRSLKKTMRQIDFKLSYDQAFPQVMQFCAAPRDEETGTWITDEMFLAYNQLHKMGVAHSIEVWFENELVGGLYGLAIGQVFYGESMFHRKTDASKVAFCYLVEQLMSWDYQLIDCQVHTNHLCSLGAEEIDRDDFKNRIELLCQRRPSEMAWSKS